MPLVYDQNNRVHLEVPRWSKAWNAIQYRRDQERKIRRRLQERLRRQKKQWEQFERNTKRLHYRVAKTVIMNDPSQWTYFEDVIFNSDLEEEDRPEDDVQDPVCCNRCGLLGHMMTKKECPLNNN